MRKVKPNINATVLARCEEAVRNVQAAMATNQSVSVQDALVAICFVSYTHVKKKSAPYASLACQLMLRVFPKLMREVDGEKQLLPLDPVVATKSLRAAMWDFPVEAKCADWHFHAIQNWNAAVRTRSPVTRGDSACYGLDGEIHAVIAYQSRKSERLAAAKAAQQERRNAAKEAARAKAGDNIGKRKAKSQARRMAQVSAKKSDFHVNWSHIYGEKLGALPIFSEAYLREIRHDGVPYFFDHVKRRYLVARKLKSLVKHWIRWFEVSPIWIRSHLMLNTRFGPDFRFVPTEIPKGCDAEAFNIYLSQDAVLFLVAEGYAFVTSEDQDGRVFGVDFSPLLLQPESAG